MAQKVKQKHGGELIRPDKGETMNPNGRPKKFITIAIDNGYSHSQVIDTIRSLLALNIEQLKEVFQNPDATILEKIVANALKKSMEKGDVFALEALLSRPFGKPSQRVQHAGDADQPVQIIIPPMV